MRKSRGHLEVVPEWQAGLQPSRPQTLLRVVGAPRNPTSRKDKRLLKKAGLSQSPQKEGKPGAWARGLGPEEPPTSPRQAPKQREHNPRPTPNRRRFLSFRGSQSRWKSLSSDSLRYCGAYILFLYVEGKRGQAESPSMEGRS